MEKWEDFEEVTVWSWIGLVFMATAVIAMACGLIWIAI